MEDGWFYGKCPDRNGWITRIDLNMCLTNVNGKLEWAKDGKP